MFEDVSFVSSDDIHPLVNYTSFPQFKGEHCRELKRFYGKILYYTLYDEIPRIRLVQDRVSC